MSWGGTPMTISLIERVEAGTSSNARKQKPAMEELLSGRVKTPEIVRLLEALNRRPVEVQELAGFARVMRGTPRACLRRAKQFPRTWWTRAGPAATVRTRLTFRRRRRSLQPRRARALRAWESRGQFAERLCGRTGGRWACELICRSNGMGGHPGDWIGFLFAQAAHTATRHALRRENRLGREPCLICWGR